MVCCVLAWAVLSAGWTYRVPAPGEAMESPPGAALPLATEIPEDLVVEVAFAGAFQRYGQIRYGDPDSTRVAVVVDQLARDRADLWVDVDRDRHIEEHERLERGADGRWIGALAVASAVDGEPVLVPRRVAFTLGEVGGILAYATMGYLEGEVALGERTVRARRVDGDGDGFFTGWRDSLFLDVDGDGELEPFREQFLYAPILSLAGQRWSLRSDPLATDLRLEAMHGSGEVRVELAGIPRDRVRALEVLLVGDDGTAALVRAAGGAVDVPPGRYRVGMVTCTLASEGDDREWSFVFSEPGGRSDLAWTSVAADEVVRIDPLGTPRLALHLAGEEGEDGIAVAPGDRVVTRPALTTGDGLLINTAYYGRAASSYWGATLSADVRLRGPEGQVLGNATSGFA